MGLLGAAPFLWDESHEQIQLVLQSQDQNNDLLSYCSPVFLIDMHGTLWGPQESRAQGWDHGTGHSEAISSEEGCWERFAFKQCNIINFL